MKNVIYIVDYTVTFKDDSKRSEQMLYLLDSHEHVWNNDLIEQYGPAIKLEIIRQYTTPKTDANIKAVELHFGHRYIDEDNSKMGCSDSITGGY